MWWMNDDVFQLKHYRSHLACHAQIIVQDAITITEKGLKMFDVETRLNMVGITSRSGSEKFIELFFFII